MAEIDERDIESYFKSKVKELKGEIRKVRWVGHRGAPDRITFLPHRKSFFAEFKAPGEKLKAHQQREHERLIALGATIFVIDSYELCDQILSHGEEL